jgi:hypothetical protein
LPVGFENNIWDGYLKNIIETGNTYSIRNEYSKLNDNIRQQLSGDIKQKVAKAWITHLGHNKESYKELNQCPQDIRNLMTPEDLQIPRQRIIGMIDNDPSYYNRDMPADIFQYLPPETRQKVRLHWAQQIYTLPKRFESCPDEIRKTFKEGFEMTAWERYITESIKRGEERVYGGGQEIDKWVPRHVREKLSPNTIALITQFYERHAIESPTRVLLDTPNEVLQKFSDDACKKIAEKLTPYIADYPDFINGLPEKITNHFQHDVETDIWRSKISEDPRQIENAPEKVKQKIPEQFVVQAWIRAITNNIHTYNNCPEKYLEQIPMVWRVNIWSRHLRANYLDYKKCPQNIKTQINESTKNIIARALATEIKKTPLNKDYYMEQFNTIWPADSEILMLLPDDVKNKLRRADIPFVRAALGPLHPIQPLRNETR